MEWARSLRAQDVLEVVAREVGKHLADEIAAWPPRVQWTAESEAARFAALFEPGAAPPSPDALSLAFELARLELRHEHDAIAYALRNATLGAHDTLAVQFLSRWLTEWLFEVNERTESRIPRAHLLAALDHAQTRLRADAAGRVN